MSASLNMVQLIGHLGRDPEIRTTCSGVPVASLSLATSETWQGKDGERVEKAEWHRLVAFRGLAKVIGDYLVSGSRVYVQGKLKTRKWQDKDGRDQYTTEVHVLELKMLGGKSKNGKSTDGMVATGQGGEDAVPDEEIPF